VAIADVRPKDGAPGREPAAAADRLSAAGAMAPADLAWPTLGE